MEPPDSRQISDGFRLLFELGAVDEQRHIAELGRQLAKLPIDPRLGRMLLAAQGESCLREVLVIVAALAIQDRASGRWRSSKRRTKTSPLPR